MQHRGVDLLLSIPLLLDDLVHDSAVENIVQIVFVQVPEAVVAFRVGLLNHKHDFIRVIEHLKASLQLRVDSFFH